MATYALGFTGGSGVCYGLRLLEVLLETGAEVHLVLSDAGKRVLVHEAGVEVGPDFDPASLVREELRPGLRTFANEAVESTPASGSAAIAATIVCPCSMGTLARIAHGFSTNLVERAADVALKEGRMLIVVPRETPLSVVHLSNMLELARAGAVVLPAMPGFYHRPQRVGDLVDFVVARVLDRLGIAHQLVERWKTPEPSGASPWDEGEVE